MEDFWFCNAILKRFSRNWKDILESTHLVFSFVTNNHIRYLPVTGSLVKSGFNLENDVCEWIIDGGIGDSHGVDKEGVSIFNGFSLVLAYHTEPGAGRIQVLSH